MLVLLIIFPTASPVVVQTVDLQLPKVAFEPTTTKPENVSLSITTESDGRCAVYWNMTRVDAKELLDRAVAKLTSDIAKAGGEGEGRGVKTGRAQNRSRDRKSTRLNSSH